LTLAISCTVQKTSTKKYVDDAYYTPQSEVSDTLYYNSEIDDNFTNYSFLINPYSYWDYNPYFGFGLYGYGLNYGFGFNYGFGLGLYDFGYWGLYPYWNNRYYTYNNFNSYHNYSHSIKKDYRPNNNYKQTYSRPQNYRNVSPRTATISNYRSVSPAYKNGGSTKPVTRSLNYRNVSPNHVQTHTQPVHYSVSHSAPHYVRSYSGGSRRR